MFTWLEDFTAFLKRSGHLDSMRPPAAAIEIEGIEADLQSRELLKGFQFPPSYRAFLMRFDGGDLTDEVDHLDYATYISFLSVSPEPEYKWLLHLNAADSVLMNHEIETYWRFEPLVIFAQDEGGSMWAFDPRAKREDGEMPVVYCDHETGDIHPQADGFEGFARLLSTRKLEYRGLGY